MNLTLQANDNETMRASYWGKAAVFLCAMLLTGVIMLATAPSSATQALLLNDDQVLQATMQESPDILGHMLNTIIVGE